MSYTFSFAAVNILKRFADELGEVTKGQIQNNLSLRGSSRIFCMYSLEP